MFFFRKRSVIFFGWDTIRAVKVNRVGGCVPSSIREFPWEPETLAATLGGIRSAFPRRARLVLAEEWIYSVVVPMTKKDACDRSCVEAAIRDRIPEHLPDTVWDYSFMKAGHAGETPETFIHAVVAKKDFFENAIRPFRSAGFLVESVDAESCAISRSLRAEHEPIIVGRGEKSGRTLLLALNQGPPLATEIVEPEKAAEAGRFVEFARERSGADFKRAYCSPDVPEKLRSALEGAGLSVEIRDFDLCAGAMAKRRLFGGDSAVLNLAE